METGKAIYIDVNDLTVGYTYQLQTSTNGRDWVDSGDPFTAVSTKMTVAYFKENNRNQLRVRVHQLP